MTTLDLARAMLIGGLSLERTAAALGIRKSLLDEQLWRAIGHDEISEVRANRVLETARADWRE